MTWNSPAPAGGVSTGSLTEKTLVHIFSFTRRNILSNGYTQIPVELIILTKIIGAMEG
jgi:hypothetical protein